MKLFLQLKNRMTKRGYLIILLVIILATSAFVIQDPYARRIFPVYADPVACSENQVFYNMITHKMLLCKNGNNLGTVALVGEGSGISSLNGLVSATQIFAIGTAGTDFSIASLTNTHTFNFPNSSSINRGLLTSADWTIFNSKQAALGFTPENIANKNAAGGYAGLTAGTKLNIGPMQEVIGLQDLTDLTGKSGTGNLAIAATLTLLATDDCLRWSGTNWVNASSCGGGGGGDMTLGGVQTVTGAKTFDPAKLIVGNVSTLPTPVLGALAVDIDDTKLYYAKDGSTWGEVFVAGLSLVNLTSNVTGILPVANGGTNNAFFTIVGPATTTKTYTLPNVSSVILTDTVHTGMPYDLSSQIDGVPTSSLKILHYVAIRSMTLSASGHQCFSVIAATAQTDFVIAIDGVSKGTLRFAAAGNTCTIVSGASDTITSGERVTITAPASADATLADITFTLSASLQ